MSTDRAMSVPFLVFADDWGRHPSSCQHLFRRLLPHHPTTWVNTIGMRRPRIDLATLRRGFEKLTHWTRRRSDNAELLPANLTVMNPWMWPYFTNAFDRRLNRDLLTRQLTRVIRRMPSPPIAVTTIPVVADLVGRLPVARWVYYCVDDFGVWPGLDQEPLRRMEEELIRKADVLIAVSETLRDKIDRAGRTAHLLTHGVDLDHWKKVSGTASHCETVPDTFSQLERPLIVFWGVVDRRMDVAWVKALSQRLTIGTILLAGPLADPDPELLALPRVVHHPPIAYSDLPRLASAASVLIMPYADLPVTRAMQPLKLKEYLATGRPTVVRDLPANREWADCADLAGNAEDFTSTVLSRVADGIPTVQSLARTRLTDESWDGKAKVFLDWIVR